MTADYGLGIDLGTTHTAAAVLTGGRVESARLGARRMEIPSAIFVKEDGELLVGEAAERRGQDEPGRLAREFKRRLGDSVPILAGGMPFSAHALTGKLLRYVLDTVTRQQGGAPASVELTYPAHWGPYKREQLDQAIRLADAGPVHLLSEPEAVARWRGLAPGETAAVYDLGGSSFDVAVIRREGDSFTLLGTPEGVDQLGGGDFDAAVYAYVLGALDGVDLTDPETAPALARLRRDCIEAKESLSFDTEVTVPVALPGRHTRVHITRSDFEGLITLAVRDTVDATQRALRSAGVKPEQLSGILLAGGSSRIPLVARVLTEEFGRPVVIDAHPELSVALGAASVAVPASIALSFGTGATTVAGHSRSENTESTAAPDPRSFPRATASNGIAATVEAASEISRAESMVAVSNGGPPTETAATEPAPAPVSVPAQAKPVSPPPVSQPPVSPPPANRWDPREFPPRPAHKQDFTDLREPVDPWAAAEAEAHAAAIEAAHAASLPVSPAPISPAAAVSSPTTPVPMTHAPVSTVPLPPAALEQTRTAGTTVPMSGSSGPDLDVEPSTQFIPATYGAGSPPAPPARRKRTLLVSGAAALVLVAAAIGVVLSNLNTKDDDAAQGTNPGASAAADPGAIPAANLLVRVDTGGDMGSDTWTTRIQYLNAADGSRRDLPGSVPGDTLPRWSNDRQQIALTNRAGGTATIYVMNREGGDRRPLVEDVTGGRVVWSADDTEVAYVKKVGKVSQIFTSPVAGGEPRQLTTSDAAKDDPIYSGDGSSIIYWSEQDGVRSLFELNLADPQEPGARLTGADLGDALDPAVSPDGAHILFTKKVEGENYDIWAIAADGSNAQAVTDDEAREMDPTWSPDGAWIAYTRGDLNHPQIVVERMDGSDEQILTKGSAREGHPCWF
ncbi:Hsp70 family protein [Actinoplanes sp. CA-015351]|uniref:Hsp70 family protein n=1 Tax=Actinoplanes sp. CA-015351 TaxID=3239897 RepID=UPI003D96284E